MKKLYLHFAAVIAALLCATSAKAAVKVTVDQVVYTLDTVAHTASATSFSGVLATDITIQATVSHEGVDYKVTTIGRNAFQRKKNITGVTIGPNVRTIMAFAFFECDNLKFANMNDSIEEIGDYAFMGCISLPEAMLNDGLGGIEMMAFQECKSLKKVRIPGSVTLIGRDVFRSDSLLTEVTLEEGLTKLGNTMFHSTPLASITLPSTLTQLNNGAFQNTNLTSVTLPAGLKSIGSSTFYGTRLSKIEIPATVTTIGKDAFGNVPLDSIIDHAATPQKLTAAISSRPNGASVSPNYDRVVLAVPQESLEAYKAANIWKQYVHIVPLHNGVGALADDAAEAVITDIYDLQGRRLPQLQKGLNICRMSNGTTRKIFMP